MTGAVIVGARMTVTNSQTGATRSVSTDVSGAYSFSDLAVGHYDLSVESTGLRPYRRTGVILDVNGALLIDAKLELGERSEEIDVEESAVHVETSDTQLGEVISGTKMTAVPLDGRSYTDLLSLQPGVAPATSLTSDTQQDVGVSALAPSGQLNPGTISINGQREFANAFIGKRKRHGGRRQLGDGDSYQISTLLPNSGSLTGNVNAEFGEYSGGQINVCHQVRNQRISR